MPIEKIAPSLVYKNQDKYRYTINFFKFISLNMSVLTEYHKNKHLLAI